MRIHILLLVILTAVLFYGCKDKEPENEINASGTIEATDVTISSKISGQIRLV